jgi:hypothetical protein
MLTNTLRGHLAKTVCAHQAGWDAALENLVRQCPQGARS